MSSYIKLKQVQAVTQGSIIIAGLNGQLSEDNTNLFWDNTNNRLGIGTNTPGYALQVEGNSGIAMNVAGGYSTFKLVPYSPVQAWSSIESSDADELRFGSAASLPMVPGQISLFSAVRDVSLGINTLTPSAALHIVPGVGQDGFRLQDGNEATGKVLTSDANGVATWQTGSGSGLIEWEESGHNFRPITPSILVFEVPSDLPSDQTVVQFYTGGVASTYYTYDLGITEWLEGPGLTSTGISNWTDLFYNIFLFQGNPYDYIISHNGGLSFTLDLKTTVDTSAFELTLPGAETYLLNGVSFGAAGLNTAAIENADLGTLPYHKIRSIKLKQAIVTKASVTFTPGTPGVANTITHNLGTSDIIVQLWDVATGNVILADIGNATSTQVDITFSSNPTGNVKAVIV
jgi:hypothetical protein